MFNQIYILSVGYSYYEPLDSKVMTANGTSTLVKSRCGKNIIVDTMTAWDGEFLVKAIQAYSLKPEDINYVVCTHAHSDHTGCNYLFTNAEWHFVGSCMSRQNKYPEYNWDTPFNLIENEIQIISTPGHTLTCISLLVNNTQMGESVVICGDLFENEQDVWDSQIWLNAGSENPKLQRENRLKVARLCSYIIPGHGKGFIVTDTIRNKLQQDINAILQK